MEEKFVTTLAEEAIKPVSKFVDALLGPRIERIRLAAERKELRDRVESPEIALLLELYFKRLLRHVSQIQTIVFPSIVLPLSKIYEPLIFRAKTFIVDHKPFDSVSTMQGPFLFSVKDIRPNANYLIIDSAGMGKSTFAKNLVLELFEFTSKLPIFLELRKIDPSETLLDRLAKEIDPSGKDIDGSVLKLLLKQGHYVIVLDGFDELSVEGRQKIGPEITSLCLDYTNNNIFYTSRPEAEAPHIPEGIVLQIERLNQKQAQSIVRRLDAVANLDIGEGLISQFDKVLSDFLKVPLLVALLYKTYGYNHSIATRRTSFYDEVFHAFYKGHDLSKAGYLRLKSSQLDAEDFRRLLRGLSFLLVTEQKYGFRTMSEGINVIENAIKLTKITPSSPSALFDDLLLSVPFFIRDGSEFRFMHKSLAEFFAAEYLCQAPNGEKIIEKINDSKLERNFFSTYEFIEDLNPSLFRRGIAAPIARRILEIQKSTSNPLLQTFLFFTDGILKRDNLLGIFSRTTSSTLVPTRFSENEISINIYHSPKTVMISNRVMSLEFPRVMDLPLHKTFTNFLKEMPISDFVKPNLNEALQFSSKRLINLVGDNYQISLKDERLANYTDNDLLNSFLIVALDFIYQVINMSVSNYKEKNNSITKVFDSTLCDNLLQSVEDEYQTQKWLEHLISKS